MARIGFVGLGHMGLPMAINLVKAGHVVTGFDLMPTAIEAFLQKGGIAAKSLKEAAINKDVIITMLQTGAQVHEACGGENGLFLNALPNTLAIDCSSIDVLSSSDLQKKAKEHALLSVDAPVSGGVAGATHGTLTFMVGGGLAEFHAATSILACMGKKMIHTGDAGSGQAAKICNNMILGVTMIAVSEAFMLAQQLGLSAQKLHEVVSSSSGQCWVMNQYVPVPDVLENMPANNDYKPGFMAAMMLKDLCLSQHEVANSGITTPMGALATNLYQQFINEGQGGLDFSAIILALTGSKLKPPI